MLLAAGTVRRYTLSLANLNAGVPSGNTALATVTVTLPNNFSAAALAAGVGGFVVPISATGGSLLQYGPLYLTSANTAVFRASNPGNVAIAATALTFALYLFDGSGASQGAGSGVVS